MFYALFLFFALVNTGMAHWHVQLWKRSQRIQHGWWGLLYVALAIVATIWQQDGAVFLMACCNRQLIFDNLFDKWRGFSVTYHSTETTSIIDQVEYLFFNGNWYAETIVYVLLLAASIIIKHHHWWQW